MDFISISCSRNKIYDGQVQYAVNIAPKYIATHELMNELCSIGDFCRPYVMLRRFACGRWMSLLLLRILILFCGFSEILFAVCAVMNPATF